MFCTCLTDGNVPALNPGGGALPYMGYIGMCRCEGYGFQAEDGIRDRSPSRGLGDVYKRQTSDYPKDKVSFSPNTVEEETVNSATTVTTVTTSTSHEAGMFK